MKATCRPASLVVRATNMGAANPARRRCRCADPRAAGLLHGIKIVAITGDDVPMSFGSGGNSVMETGQRSMIARSVSANVLGAEPIVAALAEAPTVIAGRVADPSPFVAPAMHELGWAADAWPLIGCGTVADTSECAARSPVAIADPGFKDADGLARLDLSPDLRRRCCGHHESSGPAAASRWRRTEQLLYEIHDPRPMRRLM